jgi:hypothetical protein
MIDLCYRCGPASEGEIAHEFAWLRLRVWIRQNGARLICTPSAKYLLLICDAAAFLVKYGSAKFGGAWQAGENDN